MTTAPKPAAAAGFNTGVMVGQGDSSPPAPRQAFGPSNGQQGHHRRNGAVGPAPAPTGTRTITIGPAARNALPAPAQSFASLHSGTEAQDSGRIPADLQAQIIQRIQANGKYVSFLPLLVDFSEAQEESLEALLPGQTLEDVEEIQAIVRRLKQHSVVLQPNQRSCSESPDYSCMRIALRVVGITGMGAGQVIQFIGRKSGNETVEATGFGLSIFFALGWAGAELFSHNKKENVKVATAGLAKAKEDLGKHELLQTSKKEMEKHAKNLIRQWVMLTTNCQGQFPGQLKEFIVKSWAHNLPRIQKVMKEKISLQEKEDELLEPMKSAVRCIQLAYDLTEMHFSRDIGDGPIEFERNRFSRILASLQDKFKRDMMRQANSPSDPGRAVQAAPLSSPALPAHFSLQDSKQNGSASLPGAVSGPESGPSPRVERADGKESGAPKEPNKYWAARRLGKHMRQRTTAGSRSRIQVSAV